MAMHVKPVACVLGREGGFSIAHVPNVYSARNRECLHHADGFSLQKWVSPAVKFHVRKCTNAYGIS